MRLAQFIQENMERILVEWEAFASTLTAATGMTPLALRNHAQHILNAIVKDISTPQTRQEEKEKSRGRAHRALNAQETAAQTHAILRAQSGFDINELVAEYRALRASVLRLWMDSHPIDETNVEDVVRFGEAIDQAIAESVAHFHTQVELYRNLFLGILGHDMRSPLNAILTTASYLAALNAGEKISDAATILIRSGASMRALLDDLVDFNRAKLGLGLKIAPCDIDLFAVVSDELRQIQAAEPNRRIELVTEGDPRGYWDASRLQQLVRNLVSNAIRYGAPSTPVRVVVRGEERDAFLSVTNHGPNIDTSVLGQIFDPLKRGTAHEEGLGLGLFIVREVALAHDGEVEVHSNVGETTFTVRLPRQTISNHSQ
jgi:signal transduction histidine kinase